VQTKPVVFSSVFLAVSLLLAMPAQAFDMGNMMNPSKWMGNKNKDRYDDDYYDDDFYGPPPGYGYGGYGAPGYGGYGMPGYGGYGAPGYGGYGMPGYGGYGAPGYGGGPVTPGPQGYDSGTAGAPSSGSTYTGPSYGGNYTGPSESSSYGGGQSGYGPGITTDDQQEIQRLKERIRKLEQSGKPQTNVWGN
jgi:hypothetical protein